jgi:ATP-dependent protease Clp ATPase subunit
VLFNRLTVSDLTRILMAPHGVLESFRGLLAAGGLDFSLAPDAARLMAEYAHETGTMARGLKMIVGRLIEDVVFEQRKGKMQFGASEVRSILNSLDAGASENIACNPALN